MFRSSYLSRNRGILWPTLRCNKVLPDLERFFVVLVSPLELRQENAELVVSKSKLTL